MQVAVVAEMHRPGVPNAEVGNGQRVREQLGPEALDIFASALTLIVFQATRGRRR